MLLASFFRSVRWPKGREESAHSFRVLSVARAQELENCLPFVTTAWLSLSEAVSLLLLLLVAGCAQLLCWRHIYISTEEGARTGHGHLCTCLSREPCEIT